MKPITKWSILFFFIGLFQYILFVLLCEVLFDGFWFINSYWGFTLIFLIEPLMWICLISIGYLTGKKKEKEKNFEFKKFLTQKKSLYQIEEKIRNWKQEGYNISELEDLIDNTK